MALGVVMTLEERENRQMFLLEHMQRAGMTHDEIVAEIATLDESDPDKKQFIEQVMSILTDKERKSAKAVFGIKD